MGCESCEGIVEFELNLDNKAEGLAKRINDLCMPVRERNNDRWKKFHDLVNLPVLGNLIYETLMTPSGLESEPDYYNEEWYKEGFEEIKSEFMKLEEMKKEDLKHWGDEMVKPFLPNDPSGYYTPSQEIKRSQCYKVDFCLETQEKLQGHNGGRDEVYTPDLPRKYDFNSAHLKKEGALVLDSNTRELIPQKNANWSFTNYSSFNDLGSLIKAKFANNWVRYSFSSFA